MTPAGEGHVHTAAAGWDTGLPVTVLVIVGAGYLVLAHFRRMEPRGWSTWRTAGFQAGIVLLVAALVPALSPFPTGSFASHMYQHLLIGMYAPLGLVLGAPVTLLLRSLPRRYGRLMGRLLHTGPVRVLAHPVTALVLNLGGLVLLYFTPLYAATANNTVLHHLVHVHFLAAGYLFAYSIAGPDPAPHRPSVPVRLVILGAAVAAHAVLAQLLYAGAFVQVPVAAAELRSGGNLMYYGGDIAELLLALALVTTWQPHRAASRVRHKALLRKGIQQKET